MEETPKSHWQEKREREWTRQRDAARQILNTYEPPEYGVATLDELRIDARYQRVLKERKVHELRAYFHPNACQPLAVSVRPDGSRYCVDGQHRRAVLLDIGLKSWPALIYRNLTRVQEAAMWSELNGRNTKPASNERFKAELERKDPTALAIASIVRDQGYTLQLTSHRGRRSGAQVDAIQALERIYRQTGAVGLRDVLTGVQRIWPDPDEITRTQRLVLLGLSLFLSGAWKPRLQMDRAVRVIGKFTPGVWIAKTRGVTSGLSMPEVFCEKLRAAYNKTASKKDRL